MSKELKALNDMLEYLLTYDEFNEKRHKHNAEIIKKAIERLEKWESLKITAEKAQWIKTLLNNPKSQLDKLKALEIIEENLKYGYVFIGYDKDHKPLFQFANTELYEEIKKNTNY